MTFENTWLIPILYHFRNVLIPCRQERVNVKVYLHYEIIDIYSTSFYRSNVDESYKFYYNTS